MESSFKTFVVVALVVLAGCGGAENVGGGECGDCAHADEQSVKQQAACDGACSQSLSGGFFNNSVVALTFSNDATVARLCTMSYRGYSNAGAVIEQQVFSDILQSGESRTGMAVVGINTYLEVKVSCQHVAYPSVKLAFLTTRATTPTSASWTCSTHYSEVISANGELVEDGVFTFLCNT